MRIDSLRYTERFGSVRINDLQKVLALDSGKKSQAPRREEIAVHKIEDDAIKDIEGKMAIVIPIKDEKLKLFEGVISGIPHDCLIIAVSNSKRRRVDRFKMERDTLKQFCHFTQRQAFIVHQKEPYFAQGLAQAKYSDMLDEKGLIKDGKSEGMVMGILLAMLNKKEYVAFIDSDNYIPGAVWEYIKIFASGFSLAQSPYAMVRVLWHYKPKMWGAVYFKKWGRVSEITNKYMNALLSDKTGFETEIIKTANAGEHAMSIKLAEMLPYASKYAVEPQELMSIFEGFGGTLPTAYPRVAKKGIEIFQIETKNPHLHEERGAIHLKEMILSSLSVIYHSALCNPQIKQQIMKELVDDSILRPDEEIPKPYLVLPPKKADIQSFTKFITEYLPTYSVLEE